MPSGRVYRDRFGQGEVTQDVLQERTRLAETGLLIAALVIDRATEVLTHPRAIALDNEALRVLQLAGLPEQAFQTLAIPSVRMHSPYCGEFARVAEIELLTGVSG